MEVGRIAAAAVAFAVEVKAVAGNHCKRSEGHGEPKRGHTVDDDVMSHRALHLK